MAGPSGPPFYRLRLLGAGRAPVPAIQQASYDAGYAQGVTDAGPGAGAAGTLVYDSGAAGLTFGSVSPNATLNIQFSGAGDGEFYAGRLVFSGTGTSTFQVTAVDGDERPVAFACDSGVDFCFAFDAGQMKLITFRVAYTDGDAKSMTVTMYGTDGTVIDTITASATVQDPVVAAAQDNLTGLIGVWAPMAIVASRDNGDSLFADALGAEPNIIYRRTSGSNWSIGSTDAPGTIGIVRHSVLAPDRHTDNYAIIQTAMSAGARSGMMLLKMPLQAGQPANAEIVGFEGVDGTPGPIPPTYQRFWLDNYFSNNMWNINGIGVWPMPVDTWFAIVWNVPNATTMESSHGPISSPLPAYTTRNPGSAEYSGLLPPTPSGLRVGYSSLGNARVVNDWRYGPIFLSSSPNPVSDFQAILDAIS